MYVLIVITADPDYKRPSSETVVKHFETLEDAEAEHRRMYAEWLSDNGYTEDEPAHGDFVGTRLAEYEDDPDGVHYLNSWMDQPPFDWEIREVVVENSSVAADKTQRKRERV